MTLHKIKRPGGVFSYDVLLVTHEDCGVWLYSPLGSKWVAPHDAGTLPFDVLLSLRPDRNWVAWWIDDPADRRLEIDVCLPPEQVGNGWRFVDLELDPIRHEDGTIEVQDHDEFDIACRDGWISAADAEIAAATALSLETALRDRQEPLGEKGWRTLHRLSAG